MTNTERQNTLVVVQDWCKRNGLTTASKRNTMLEAYRRTMLIHNGNVSETRTLALPSDSKNVKEFLITTTKVVPRTWGWYKLTDKGKELVQDLIKENIWSEYLNSLIYSNQML